MVPPVRRRGVMLLALAIAAGKSLTRSKLHCERLPNRGASAPIWASQAPRPEKSVSRRDFPASSGLTIILRELRDYLPDPHGGWRYMSRFIIGDPGNELDDRPFEHLLGWAAGYREVGRSGVSGGSPKALVRYSQPFIRMA